MQLRPAVTRQQWAEVDGLLNPVLVSFPSDKVMASVEKLRSALQTEREEKENSLVEKIEEIMARTIKDVESSPDPPSIATWNISVRPLLASSSLERRTGLNRQPTFAP